MLNSHAVAENICKTGPPAYLRDCMTAPPPPPLYLKVWIRRCHVSKSCYLLDESQLPSLLYYKCIAFPKRPCDIFLKLNQLQSSQTVFLIIFLIK